MTDNVTDGGGCLFWLGLLAMCLGIQHVLGTGWMYISIGILLIGTSLLGYLAAEADRER